MKQLVSLIILFYCCTASPIFAQTPSLDLKLQLLPDGESWGVFVKPKDNITPSPMTITGGAQVTVVMPLGFQWTALQNHSGYWTNDATASGPIENPDRAYFSFGLVAEVPPIAYVTGQETLLFSFKRVGACPDTMFLIDNSTDPFNVLPNSFNNNPGNELSVIDFGQAGQGGLEFYSYSDNYAASAWNCHDCDGDGIPNALDDDDCFAQKCLELKLQWRPNADRWDVMLRAKPGQPFTWNNTATAGRVTIAAPTDFEYHSLTSKKGTWELSAVLDNPIENPGMKYLTFEMQPGNVPLNLNAWSQNILFTFKRSGDCPDSLYLTDGPAPGGIPPNELNGQGHADGQVLPFQICGVYGPHAWDCQSLSPPDEIPVETASQLQVVQEPGFANGQALNFSKSNLNGPGGRLRISPNPATDWLDVSFLNHGPEANTSVRLWNLQGQLVHFGNPGDANHLRLDLTALQPGVYFLTLEVDGKVVQREKVVKKPISGL